MTPSITLSIVIPLFNEEKHLNTLLEKIRQQIATLNIPDYQLILIDDGSSDNTWQQILDQAQNDPQIHGIRLSRNFGKEAAICAGLEKASGQATILLDGDLQHPPSLIADMVNTWKNSNVNIVEAVKASRGKEGLFSKVSSKTFYCLFSKLSGFHLQGASDYKLIDHNVREAWITMGERNLFFRGMIAWLGFTRTQIPFAVHDRPQGKSRWSTLALTKLALTAISAFSTVPLRLAGLMSVIFFIFAVILGGQALYKKIAGQALTGFTTVILLQLIIGSLLLFTLGIIGEYIARIYDEVKHRPRYIIKETFNPAHKNQ